MLARRHRPPASVRRLVVFRLAGRRFGLAPEHVARVTQIEGLMPMPSDLRCNLGLVQHLGVVAGVIDLAFLLDLRELEPPRAPFLCVFARLSRGVVGFPIDEIEGLEAVGELAPVGIEVLDTNQLETLR